MGRMARQTANAVVPIYSPHKAVALVMAGHRPTHSLELDGIVIAWFKKTAEFDAACERYERIQPVAEKAKDPRSPIGLTDFLRIVEEVMPQ